MRRNPSKQVAPPTPEALAVVASWLDNPSHLGRPPVEDFLQDIDTAHSLQAVSGLLSREVVEETRTVQAESSGRAAASSSESAFHREPFTLPPSETVAPLGPGAGGVDLASQTLPDQLRHPGVETLLAEYYKMVATSRGHSHIVANRHKPSLIETMMRVFLPTFPRWAEAQGLYKMMRSSLVFLASVAVHLAVLVLPAWLYILRHMASSGNMLVIFLIGLMGAWLLYSADKIHNARLKDEESNAKNWISAFHIGPDGRMPPEAHKFLEAISKCQDSGASTSCQQYSPAEGSQPPMPAINLHASGNREYVILAREVEEVKFAVLGDRTIPKQSNGSGVGELRIQIRNLCDAVGVDCNTQSLGTIPLMRAKLSEVRRIVGC